jgi:threonine/homoserine/homoserine lactone efflux protein
MRIGWRKTLPSVLAPLLSDGPIILIVLLVLTQVPDWYLRFLRIGGGLFILYLAFGAFANLRRDKGTISVDQETSQKSLLKATVTNFLNPNPYLYWSFVTGPILLAAWRQSAAHGASFILGFYGTLIGSLAFLVIIFATAGRVAPQIARIMSVIAVVALAFFGLYQLWSGIYGQ